MGCIYDTWADGCSMEDEYTECEFEDCWTQCNWYKSDWTCPDCYADFNLDEECTCE